MPGAGTRGTRADGAISTGAWGLREGCLEETRPPLQTAASAAPSRRPRALTCRHVLRSLGARPHLATKQDVEPGGDRLFLRAARAAFLPPTLSTRFLHAPLFPSGVWVCVKFVVKFQSPFEVIAGLEARLQILGWGVSGSARGWGWGWVVTWGHSEAPPPLDTASQDVHLPRCVLCLH